MINFCNFHIVNKYKPPDRIDIYGNKYWYDENGDCHRDFDLPAVVYNDGLKLWMKHGKCHRVNPLTNELDLDYPAVIYCDGSEEYWKDDIRYILYSQNNKLIKYEYY